jgi:acetyl esterase/lipase
MRRASHVADRRSVSLTELATYDVELAADLVYTVAGGRPRLLDLYLPIGAPRPLPVIVWLHAGGWRSGDRKHAPDLSRHFAMHGFAMASVDYRLSGEAMFPAQLHDVKAAIRWLRASAGGYGIDDRRIGLWGASAGGHLATLAALTSNEEVGHQEHEADAHRDLPTDVQAVVTAYAPIDFLQMDAQRDDTLVAVDDPSAFVLPPGARTADARSYESLLIGAPIHDRPDLARAASPLSFIAAGAPPFLIVHGRSDRAVPVQQSELLHDALARCGTDVTLHLMDGLGHGFLDRPDAAPAAALAGIEAFFRRHLTGTTFDRPASDGAK